MGRLLKKLLVLLIIGAAGVTILRSTRRAKPAFAPAPSKEWPPFEPREQPAKTGAIGSMAAEAEEAVDHLTATKPAAVKAPAAKSATTAKAAKTAKPAPEPAASPAPKAASDWVAPVAGACPDGYPIKANDSSHIYHVPGGRFYERTVAERCYASAESAERDGYRRAKA